MLGALGIKGAVVDLIQAGLAAGTGSVNSNSVDMSGFDGCLFVGLIGAQDAGASAEIDIAESSDNATWSLLANTFLISPVNSDDKVIVIDYQKPKRRYLRTSLVRTGTTTWGGTIAIRYRTRGTPVPVGLGHIAGSPLQQVTDSDS